MEKEQNSASPLDIPVMPADEQIAKLKAEVSALRAMIFTSGNRSMTMEGRTFTVMENGFIGDNNFDFDAGMRLTGDFVDDDEKRQYAEMIADVLNRHNAALRGDSGLIAGVPLESTVRGEKSTLVGR
jgi:hypothetical protein